MSRLPHLAVLALGVVAWAVQGLQGLLYAGIAALALEMASLRFDLVDLSRARWKRARLTPSPDALQRSFSQLRDEVVTAGHSSREFDRALRLRLTRIFALQLLERRGVRLDQFPYRARQLVDIEVWELLDPARAAVVDRDRTGVDLAAVRYVVDELEAL